MRWVRFPLIFLLILLLLSSCAPKRSEILLDTQATDASTLIKLVQERQEKLQSLVGRGTVTFESPERSGTVAFEMALRKPDSLLVTFEWLFGIDLGTLFLSREKYLLYNSTENKVVTGVPSAAAVRSVIPFDLTLDQVVQAFSGSFPIPGGSQSPHAYSIDRDMFLLSFACGSKTCSFWVDNRDLLVKRHEIRDEQGELVMDAVASSFTEDETSSAPRYIRVRFPSQERQISVSYSSITLNDPHPSFSYSIPPNARTIVR